MPIEQPSIEVLEPGLVIIRGALDLETQALMASVAMERGRDPERGFWRGAELNSSASCKRGRVFDAIEAFDARLVDHCSAAVQMARGADPQMPDMTPTHLLMVYYLSGRGIFWHKDDAPNDGCNDRPVVSFSLGNTCTFGLCHKWSWGRSKEHSRTVELRSGDCILFGGPCRYIHHAVKGLSYRPVTSRVAAYALPAARLRRWSEAAMRELQVGRVLG